MAKNASLNIAELIDQSPLSSLQIITICLCALVMFLDGYSIGTVSTTAPLLAGAVHVKVSSFGPVFALGFAGVAVGSLFFGSVADRVGRKWMVIMSVFVFGFFTLITSQVGSLHTLALFRFLTGVGIGGAMPNVLALTSEYSPKRHRAFLMTTMFTGVPIGGASSPLLGSFFLTHGGWRFTFYFGGIFSLLLCLLLIPVLPESIRFLVTKRERPERIVRLLTRAFGSSVQTQASLEGIVNFDIAEDHHGKKVPLSQLLKEGRAAATLLLWISNFMILMIALVVVSWFPTVLLQNGLPLGTGLRIAALFSVGGVVGQPILGRLMDRWSPYVILTITFCLAAILVGSFGFAGSSLLRLAVFTFLAGFCVFGSQAGLMPVAATLYPTSLRASGLGWVLGIGRTGSIVGPILGGMMLARHWSLTHVFMAAAVPAIIGACCIALTSQLAPKDRSTKPASVTA